MLKLSFLDMCSFLASGWRPAKQDKMEKAIIILRVSCFWQTQANPMP